MAAMVMYEVRVILNNKETFVDDSGPYFGGYLNRSQAVQKAQEIEKRPDVFTTIIDSINVMI